MAERTTDATNATKRMGIYSFTNAILIPPPSRRAGPAQSKTFYTQAPLIPETMASPQHFYVAVECTRLSVIGLAVQGGTAPLRQKSLWNQGQKTFCLVL